MNTSQLNNALFDESGYLSDKVHQMNLESFIEAFCHGRDQPSNTRNAYEPAIKKLFEWARELGVTSLVIGGSFVTNKPDPGDLDVLVLVPKGVEPKKLPSNVSAPRAVIDAQSLSEAESELVQAFIQLIGTDKRGVGRGVVQIKLHTSMKSYEKKEVDSALFNVALLSYVFRSRIRTAPEKKLVIPIHGIRSEAIWLSKFTLLASTSGWSVAPFMYGFENGLILADEAKKKAAVQELRMWIEEVRSQFDGSISIVAHSFGTYLVGRYLKEAGDISSNFAGVVLAGSILCTDYPWDGILDNFTVAAVLNTRSENDQWVNMIPKNAPTWLPRDPLMGRAAVDGFTTKHARLIERTSNLLDHNNMFSADVILDVWLPFLNVAHLEQVKATEIAEAAIASTTGGFGKF